MGGGRTAGRIALPGAKRHRYANACTKCRAPARRSRSGGAGTRSPRKEGEKGREVKVSRAERVVFSWICGRLCLECEVRKQMRAQGLNLGIEEKYTDINTLTDEFFGDLAAGPSKKACPEMLRAAPDVTVKSLNMDGQSDWWPMGAVVRAHDAVRMLEVSGDGARISSNSRASVQSLRAPMVLLVASLPASVASRHS